MGAGQQAGPAPRAQRRRRVREAAARQAQGPRVVRAELLRKERRRALRGTRLALAHAQKEAQRQKVNHSTRLCVECELRCLSAIVTRVLWRGIVFGRCRVVSGFNCKAPFWSE